MKTARLDSTHTQADGLRAVCNTPITLPDLCHHAEYRIYVDGQYVESVGNLGRNAEHALEFWQRRRRKQTVEVRPIRCTIPNCDRRQ